MARRLRGRGYTVSEGSSITREKFPEDGAYDLVTLMNLLDRCDHPLEMLRDAARLARRGTGRVVVALVLPYGEFVEEGSKRRPPRGPLPMGGARCSDGATLEESLAVFITRVVLPLGLEVERLARVPYLCRGDARQPFYVLSDALLVLKHREGEEVKCESEPWDIDEDCGGMEQCKTLMKTMDKVSIKIRER